MNEHTLNRPLASTLLSAHLERGIAGTVFPGGVVALRSGRSEVVSVAGKYGYEADAPRMTAGAVFDLASLSKIVATLPLVLLGLASGRIEPDDRADRFLPELATGAGSGWNHAITVRGLLSHTSGLPAWRPYYVRLRGRSSYLAAIADEQAAYPPGTRVEYSDLGFMLLGWLVERVFDTGVDELARDRVWKPLGMVDTSYRPMAGGLTGPHDDGLFVPTEEGNGYEHSMALAYAEGRPVAGGHSESFRLETEDVESFLWRTGVIQGQVHDGNCHYGLGGVSGHAGVFSTAGDLVRFASFWDRGGPLPLELRGQAFSVQTPAGQATRGLGWVIDTDGTAMHTGFTGTLLRYCPDDESVVVALTNRVHPRVQDGIAAWRTELARIAGTLRG